MVYFVKVMNRIEFEKFVEELLEGEPNPKHVHEESGLMLEDVHNHEDWYTPYGEKRLKNKERKIYVRSLGEDSDEWLLRKGFVVAA